MFRASRGVSNCCEGGNGTSAEHTHLGCERPWLDHAGSFHRPNLLLNQRLHGDRRAHNLGQATKPRQICPRLQDQPKPGRTDVDSKHRWGAMVSAARRASNRCEGVKSPQGNGTDGDPTHLVSDHPWLDLAGSFHGLDQRVRAGMPVHNLG